MHEERAVDTTQPGGEEVQELLQSSWAIARMTNIFRDHEGIGHGRSETTAASPDMANLVVREACSVAELVQATRGSRVGR